MQTIVSDAIRSGLIPDRQRLGLKEFYRQAFFVSHEHKLELCLKQHVQLTVPFSLLSLRNQWPDLGMDEP